MVGDSVTTDHISPAGSIKKDSPAGKFLLDNNVKPIDFNSYGSRRGNDRVMTRGTFANIRLKNLLAPGTEGGVTRYLGVAAPLAGRASDPNLGKVLPIYDAAMEYKKLGVPLIVIAGRDYGMGSSRDWAAKGTFLLGVKAVIAESFERTTAATSSAWRPAPGLQERPEPRHARSERRRGLRNPGR